MVTRMFRYGIFLLGLVSSALADTDPCQADNHVIMNDPTRFTTYQTVQTSVRCDTDLVKQWYRIPFGSVATTPPPVYRCGTDQPVWIQPETLPATGESKLVTICLRTQSDVCAATGYIEVKNCGSFYVYELRQLNPDYCNLAYCLEADSSTKVLPFVTTSLVEGTTTIQGGNTFPSKTILFTCDLEYNTDVDPTALYYDVVWYINDQELKRLTDLSYSSFLSDGNLRENDWIEQHSLPMQVACAIEAKSGVSTGTGNFERSASFFAGFKAELSGDTLQENGELELAVRLTVPLGCMYAGTDNVQQYEEDNCFMDIRVVTPSIDTDQCTLGGVTNNAITFTPHICTVKIYHTTWNTTTVMKVHGAPDNIINSGHRSARIQLRSDFVPAHNVWENVFSEIIEVHVHDDDINIMGKQCHSSNDPHMKTFDGRPYELQRTGEFVLYEHEELSIAIHAYFQACEWGIPNAKCNCGIAIKNQNAVFRANFCKHSDGYNNIIEFNGCDEDAMTINAYRSLNTFGSGFEIILPSGTMVTFKYGSYVGNDVVFIHYIYIKPSILDWKTSQGLCGYLDGTTTNDFKKKDGSDTTDAMEFSESWKIVSGSSKSLFINPLETHSIPTTMIHEYCTCKDKDQISCSASPAEPCSSSDPSNAEDFTGYVDTCIRTFSKRDTDDQETVYFPQYPNEEESDDEDSEIPDWSGNWTEASATATCREFLRASPLIQICEQMIPGFDSEVYVPDCTKDVKLTGSTLFMESTLSLLQTACIAEAVRLENLTTESTANGSTILEDILSISCSNNCSNAGSCINGTCQCETGYGGVDCSESGSISPSLSQDRNMGLCDSSINVCSKIAISGRNFMRQQLTCKARRFKIMDSVVQMEGEPVIFSAIYVNAFLAVCKIPASRKRRSTSQNLPSGYKISLSNDGTTFSSEVISIIFDFKCFDCNITSMTCIEKTGDGCSQTVEDTLQTTAEDDSSGTNIAVGVTVVIIVLIIVIVLAVCIKKHYLKRPKIETIPEKNNFNLSTIDSSDLIIGAFPAAHTYPSEKPSWIPSGTSAYPDK
ncbi:von Willebrand factor D and EGF domain-containing protein-like [Pecten maximus]|uniref:von Willebrand factor D and EGF domain-containing protein-like n=1 Tax=Pecten maximus TaxID=6579 RepID=UPI0014590E7A|nr:von Willebrand factor D and EGF domain-containing protein-like [Pecten maximus]